MKRILACFLSIVLLVTNGDFVSLAAGAMDGEDHFTETQEWMDSISDTVSDNVSDNAYIGSEDGEDEMIPVMDYSDMDVDGANRALEQLTKEQEIMALVYLCDAYNMKETPSEDAKPVYTAASGQTVYVKQVALDSGRLWYQCSVFTMSETEEFIEYTGYIQREYLAYSDERLIALEEEYFSALVSLKMNTYLSSTAASGTVYTSAAADVAQFPASYQAKLTELKNAHPNWTFVKMTTNLDWNSVIAGELTPDDKNLVYYTLSDAWKGRQYDSKWYCATREAVEYSMDPRNHFTDQSIFQFELLTYNASYHNESSIQNFLNSSFMAGQIPGEGMTYAKAFVEIGSSRGLSPFHLAARVYQEQGKNGTSPLISGTYPGYEGYYNYFNVGASGTGDAVYKSGLSYAKSKGWNTRYKSLAGGAATIGNGYILKGQDTLYLEKFDIIADGGLYNHQYMQNVTAPVTEAKSVYNMYNQAGAINSRFVFKIPVYNNMPDEVAYPDLKVSLNKTKAELILFHEKKAPTLQLKATITPADASVTGSWKSSNTKVATVNDNGLVTAVGGGIANITFTAGGKSATCVVTVTVPATDIEMKETEISLYAGTVKTVGVKMLPEDATEELTYIWSSKDPAIATVSDGNVTGVSVGETEISVSANVTDPETEEKKEVGVSLRVIVKGCKIFYYDEAGKLLQEEDVAYGSQIGTFPVLPEKEETVFSGWYTKPNGEGIRVSQYTKVYGDISLYPFFISTNQKFFVKAVGDQVYTGSAIKPSVTVYDGNQLLTEKIDYTVSYSNNKKVNGLTGKQPTITVKGKGNYTGTQKITFNIVAKNIEDGDITGEALLANYSGKVQKPAPVLYRDGKKLKKGTDYILSYPESGYYDYRNPGTYKVLVTGVGGYFGTREVPITITRKTLLSKVTVKSVPAQEYTGKPIELDNILNLTYGGKRLVEGTDYTVSYENNTEIGTASAIISAVGNGAYAGSRKVTFKITGISMKKVKVTGLSAMPYDGGAYTLADFPNLAVTYRRNSASATEFLKEGVDYRVVYKNNVKKGTATIEFSGIGKYTGVLKKTFKITAFNMAENSGNCVSVDSRDIVFAYQKDNNKPKITVSFKGRDGVKTVLTEGVDYTLSYINNKGITDVSTGKIPQITIKGKGNFTGTFATKIPFTIVGTDIETAFKDGLLVATIPEILYSQTKTDYKPSVTLMQGKKKLKAGTDYEIVEYTSNQVTEYFENQPEKNLYTVTIRGLNNYSGTLQLQYRLYSKKISKAVFQSIVATEYDYWDETGFCPIPEGTYRVTKEGAVETLVYGKDFTVTYQNNHKAGTAKVIVSGIGDYGGTKKLSFKINRRILEKVQ